MIVRVSTSKPALGKRVSQTALPLPVDLWQNRRGRDFGGVQTLGWRGRALGRDGRNCIDSLFLRNDSFAAERVQKVAGLAALPAELHAGTFEGGLGRGRDGRRRPAEERA